jgi:DNA-binding MarR family transcriptional regulator
MIDQEHRITEDTHESLRLWLRLLSTTTTIETVIRAKMREEFGITLPRFDLMAQLERHEQGLSMGELSQRLMVSGGNITSITDQLEKEKMVVRVNDKQDRRSIKIMQTTTGRDAFKDMAEKHEQWIIALLEGFNEQTSLHKTLGALKNTLQTNKDSLI